MKNNKLNKSIKMTLLAGAGILIFEWTACISNQNEEAFRSHPVLVTNHVPEYFNNLFKSQSKDKLRLINSYERIGRDTVSNFLYNQQYYIQLYKLSMNYSLSLKKSIKKRIIENKQEAGVPFYDNERSRIMINDKMVTSKSDAPSNIFISFDGQNLRTVSKDDSLAYYSLEFKSLSIKYNINGPQEIYADIKKSGADIIPIELMFLKKNNMLFMIWMSPKEDNSTNLLSLDSLINNRN